MVKLKKLGMQRKKICKTCKWAKDCTARKINAIICCGEYIKNTTQATQAGQ